MPSAAIQMLLDGGVENIDQATGMSFPEFMRISRQEDGLLSPAQAALVLDVSKQRVAQLMESGALRKFTFLEKPYVSGRDVDVRRKAELSKGGRPRKLMERVKLAAKVVAGMDRSQVAAAALE